MKSSTLAAAALLALAFAPASASQKAPRSGEASVAAEKSPGAENPAEDPLRARALSLAGNTADEALKWDDHRTAVGVLCQASDLLWDDDPDRARDWLTRAWELTSKVGAAEVKGQARRTRNESPESSLRWAILEVAHRRDPQLADRLIERLTDQKEEAGGGQPRGVFDDRTARSEQLLNLALRNINADPVLAVSLAERSLSDGISFQLQLVLMLLHQRDRAAANRLFDAALSRLETGFADASEGQVIAAYLFTPGRITGAGREGGTVLAVVANAPNFSRTPAEADVARARSFLRVMQRALLNAPVPPDNAPSRAQELAALILSLRDGYRQYAPDLLPEIEQRLAQLLPDLAAANRDKAPAPAPSESMRAALAAGDGEFGRLYVDALEEAADKETDHLARKLAFARAALATDADDFPRGRSIAAKINEPELRGEVVSFLAYRAALAALKRKRPDEAVALASESKPLPRAAVLVSVAQHLIAEARSKGDRQSTARPQEILSDAEKLLNAAAVSGESLRVRVGLVAAIASIDTVRALGAANELVVLINGAGSFDANATGTPRLFGLTGLASHVEAPGVGSGYGLKDVFVPLAEVDFDGSVYLAGKLTAPAARGVCMMAIAGKILGKHLRAKPASTGHNSGGNK
jgi:hypothetical protein